MTASAQVCNNEQIRCVCASRLLDDVVVVEKKVDNNPIVSDKNMVWYRFVARFQWHTRGQVLPIVTPDLMMLA